MTTLTIELPEELRNHVESTAREEGTSVDTLVTAALIEYLEDLTDAREAEEITRRMKAGKSRKIPLSAIEAR
jgi:predicted DNA-binding protein